MAYYFDFSRDSQPLFPPNCPVCLKPVATGKPHTQKHLVYISPLFFLEIIGVAIETIFMQIVRNILMTILTLGLFNQLGWYVSSYQFKGIKWFRFRHPVCDDCRVGDSWWPYFTPLALVTLALVLMRHFLPDQWRSSNEDLILKLEVYGSILLFPVTWLIIYLKRDWAKRLVSRKLRIVGSQDEMATYRVELKSYIDLLAAKNQITVRESP